jgi:tetratricopeptide (TPR) repeat protein
MLRLILCLVLSLLAATPASAKWYRAESPHFIVFGTSPKELQTDVERLERFDQLLRSFAQIPENWVTSKLTVYMVRDTSVVTRLIGGKATNIAGFYTANPSGAFAVVPRSAGNNFDDVVLFHEYAHHLMLHYFPTAYPAWYVEGFAEFLSTTTFGKEGASIGLPAQHRAYELTVETTLPIETLLSYEVGELKEGQVGNFYGRAWLLTHYLTFEPTRKGQQKAYLAAINAGTKPIDAARKVFGDLPKLQRELDRYLRSRKMSYMKWTAQPKPVSIAITPLEDSIGEAMHDRIRLSRGTSEEEREPIAARLRAQIAKTPGNAALLTLLAEAELDLERYDAAIAAAEKAIAIDPKLSRAHLWRGTAMMQKHHKEDKQEEAKWKAARVAIVKANRADPDDALALYNYFLSFRMEGKETPAIAVDGLAKAVVLLPQVSDFRFPYAEALARNGSYKEAIAIMQPIANSPHKGEMATAAREIIAKLQNAVDKGTKPKDFGSLGP